MVLRIDRSVKDTIKIICNIYATKCFARALEERKKVAEEREARKRALQLSKRRQRQTEATEKYQRAHLPPKPANEKTRPLSGDCGYYVSKKTSLSCCICYCLELDAVIPQRTLLQKCEVARFSDYQP